MWNEPQHWIWLAWGLGLLLVVFIIYYVMIKSAECVRYRVYQSDVTVPILHESFRQQTKTEEIDKRIESEDRLTPERDALPT